jgi:PAS domain-containing protein
VWVTPPPAIPVRPTLIILIANAMPAAKPLIRCFSGISALTCHFRHDKNNTMSPLTTEASLETISRMLDELDEPRIVITEQFEILHANPAYQALYGQVVGQRCHAASTAITGPAMKKASPARCR